jgi:uncharacterized protein (DUF58 family)
MFLTRRVFIILAVVVFLFAFSFQFGILYGIGQDVFSLLGCLLLIDSFLLYHNKVKFELQRHLPKVFSLSDANKVQVTIRNLSTRDFDFVFIDEIPHQFQKRDFLIKGCLKKLEQQQLQYELRPTERGEYQFGNLILFIQSRLGLIERRITQEQEMNIAVYPSVLQMKQYGLYALEKISLQQGVKKIRRIGHSYAFDQIKEYVNGDNYRNINWQASSRAAKLMLNHYETEKSQQIYCVIDKSRSMNMPFNELTLMDYAINATLAISSIALQKQDKAGLITFSDKIGAALKADSNSNQLHKILQHLYREEERPVEANYELLHQIAQKIIKGRSLFLLFLNFEHPQALERILPILRRINHTHLLMVVFFENTEVQEFATREVKSLEDIYQKTIAQQFLYDKQQMVIRLRQFGIQTVLTKPQDLTFKTINKYLELKAKGLI